MTSLVGAAGTDFADVLKALGYRSETRQGPAITVPIKRAAVAPMEPFKPAEASTDGEAPAEAVEGETPEMATAEPEAAPVEAEVAVETPVEAVAETPAEAPVEPDAEAAAPAEPVTIEVWRMGRAERPQHRGDRRPHRGGNRPGQQADGAPGERTGEQRRGPPPWKRGPKPGEQPRPAEGAPAEGSEAPRRHDDQRRDRREKFEKFGKREDRPQGENRGERGGKPFHKGGRPDRENRERGPEHRVFATSGPQPGRKGEKAADPDSPFAKLAALKAQLEGKN